MKQIKIYETINDTSNLKINESSDGLIHLTGTFGVAGVKNRNNRTYNKENYGAMVEQLQETIAERGLCGEMNHPSYVQINMENISHKIDNITMNEDGTVTGEITLLETPKGNIAKALVTAGLPLFISSRGLGTMDENGNVELSKIITYDLVYTSGFEQAKFNMKENEALESIDEGCYIVFENEESQKVDEDKPQDEPQVDETQEEQEADNKVDEEEKVDETQEDEKENKLNDLLDAIKNW